MALKKFRKTRAEDEEYYNVSIICCNMEKYKVKENKKELYNEHYRSIKKIR